MNDEHQDYQKHIYYINNIIFMGLAKTIGEKKDTHFNMAGRGQRFKLLHIPLRCPEAFPTSHIGLRCKSSRKSDGGQVRDCAGDEAL
jgi:hypothetical protein